ncbi:MAG TPA: hypothetical protein VFM93_12755 [Candidatus Limnocylindria bacterium]|nr:hypothetical protein [Candidatus Limnocylindria bacterium]
MFPVSYNLEDQLGDLADALRATGDHAIFVSVLHRPPEQRQHEYPFTFHFKMDVDEFEREWPLNPDLRFVDEIAIYSEGGRGGVMLGEEEFMVVAGTARFLDAVVRRQERQLDDQARDFVAMWGGSARDEGRDASFLGPLLAHVYGAEHAADLMDEQVH